MSTVFYLCEDCGYFDKRKFSKCPECDSTNISIDYPQEYSSPGCDEEFENFEWDNDPEGLN